MSGWGVRRFGLIAGGLVLVAVLVWTRLGEGLDRGLLSAKAVPEPPSARPAPGVNASSALAGGSAFAELPEPGSSEVSHLADDLNAPSGNIRRDLEIVNELLSTWQTNFPREGNPVGENHEITAALAGANALKFAFISRRHPAINAQGEMCDRWGTPLRFHAISGHQMEIRSAGPDRQWRTPDDAQGLPPP